jgi:hypothetical protein
VVVGVAGPDREGEGTALKKEKGVEVTKEDVTAGEQAGGWVGKEDAMVEVRKRLSGYRLFQAADCNASEFLDVKEFTAMMRSIGHEKTSSAKLRGAFEKLDANKDGLLSRDKFLAYAIENLPPGLSVPSVKPDAPMSRGAEPKAQAPVSAGAAGVKKEASTSGEAKTEVELDTEVEENAGGITSAGGPAVKAEASGGGVEAKAEGTTSAGAAAVKAEASASGHGTWVNAEAPTTEAPTSAAGAEDKAEAPPGRGGTEVEADEDEDEELQTVQRISMNAEDPAKEGGAEAPKSGGGGTVKTEASASGGGAKVKAEEAASSEKKGEEGAAEGAGEEEALKPSSSNPPPRSRPAAGSQPLEGAATLGETPVAEKGQEAASTKKPGEEGAAEGAVEKKKQEGRDGKEEGGVGGGVQGMPEGNAVLAEKQKPEASKNVDEVSLSSHGFLWKPCAHTYFLTYICMYMYAYVYE